MVKFIYTTKYRQSSRVEGKERLNWKEGTPYIVFVTDKKLPSSGTVFGRVKAFSSYLGLRKKKAGSS
jgi:hypothetical protein